MSARTGYGTIEVAGDWIKVEHATLDKPEVSRFAEILGVPHGVAFELLIRFWIWMDNNASGKCPGNVRHMSATSLDETMKCSGFSGALSAIGWLEIDEKTVSINVPNFSIHNGNTAKTRASDAKRKSEERLKNVRIKPDKTRTREEKRREDIKPKALSGTPDLSPFRQQANDALERLNRLAGRAYRPVPANLDPIIARLKEGYTERDLRVVIAMKCQEWKADEKMVEFLRPKTLFNRTNFSNYAGQIPPLKDVINGD